MKMSAQKLFEIAFAAAGMAIAAFLFADTFKESYTAAYNFAQTSSALFPRIVLGLWIALSAVIIVKALVQTAEADEPFTCRPPGQTAVAVLAFAGGLAAVLALGALIGIVVAFAAAAWACGYRRLVPLALLSLAATGAVQLAFSILARVPLPAGAF